MNNTMWKFKILFILLNLTFFNVASYAAEQVVTFGVDSDFPPFSYVANNTPHGYENDLIRLIFEKGDYKLELKYGLPWSKIYEQTSNNQMDICGTLVRTPERAEHVYFTDDAYTRYYGVFTGSNSEKIDVEFLGRYRLGAVKGCYSEILVRDQLKASRYEVFDSYLQMIIALKENRIDAFIETTEVVKYYILKSDLVGQVILQHDGLFPQSVPFGIAKNRPDLVEFINKRLKEIKASGEYEIIYIKNFSAHSSDYYDAKKRTDRWIIIGITIGLAAVALAFIVLLKQQVKRATAKIIQREDELRKSEAKLKIKNEELNAAIEEMEESNEELQAAMEEMEVTNEELITTTGVLQINKKDLQVALSERKLSEEIVKSLLAEKELLLQEVHHRIKNNMNTIKGLLTLQLTAEENPKVTASLRDAESRVQSMIMLYDRLYCTDNYRELPIKEYLERLADEIVGSFPNSGIIKIETNIDDIILNVAILTPLGIIVNELFTNIMKYAFAGRDSGVINLSASIKDNHAKIEIRDNGVGIPESVIFARSTGFGLDLVNMLTQQIGGSIRIVRENGSSFILEFDLH